MPDEALGPAVTPCLAETLVEASPDTLGDSQTRHVHVPRSRTIQTVKVLVVSESVIVRAGVKAVLNGARDVQVVGEASTTDEIPDLLRARRPTLLLLSPLKSVIDSLERLRSLKVGDLSAMLIARHTNPVEVSRALLLGCAGYVDLEVTPDTLVQSVRRVARGERVVEQAVLDRVLRDLPAPPTGPEGMFSAPERDVVRLLAAGHTNREIARRLGYSLGTVKDYVQQILQKLEARNRTQAAVKAVQLGI